MATTIASIGFGEAGQAFARPGIRAYDRKGAAIGDAYGATGVISCETPAAALADASAVLSLVTADQALPAARAYAALLAPGALWLDMNSVAPDTKRAAAQAIATAGGRYVDVAVMAPVLPARLAAPLLLAGPHAAEAEAVLRGHGFTNVAIVGPAIGAASSIKMIRSVMVKGLEALTAECALAAERAGVLEPVIASLDASWKPQGWETRIDYNLDRMMAHGLRRAAEMEEVAVTLAALGVDPAMTRGTIERQRTLGNLGLTPPAGLTAKLAALGDTQ
ncbi:NAD(P)-dependent oxidoreductase [uncultured Sphingomonas sp.]|uniref:NAD(P)-dependent oxidoreductase n=1 Tax=uncultured Sphingomonas sp. TaxID=158754 RepID=UPI0025EFCD22|nr:NAD(P)-dependent oxidoreductase [uncultured Sphingomonas sp.]